jgi:hypothetical protein
MSLDFNREVFPEYVRIEFRGAYSFSDLMKQIEKIKAAAAESGRDNIFIDALSVEGRMTESEKFFVGSHIAEVFGSKLKAVCLMPEGYVTKLGEMAAVNRGARFFVTESKDEAMDWLVPKSQERSA